MSRRNLPIYRDVLITGVAAEGKALTRIDDVVVFVPYCVPGDVVDLQVTKKKHSFMEACVIAFKQYSDTRCQPVCKHFGTCGGCKWQNLPYNKQLEYKQQQVVDNLTRIGKVALPEIEPIKGSKQIYEYRNKLEFTFADHQWLTTEEMKAGVPFQPGLGFHMPSCFDKVMQVDECHLMAPLNDEIRNAVYRFAVEHDMTFYNEHTHEGQLRNLIIRNNQKGEYMVVLVFGEPFGEAVSQATPVSQAVSRSYSPKDGLSAKRSNSLLQMLHDSFPQIISLQYVINEKFNDTIGDLDVHVFFGEEAIIEQMEDLQFKVGPKSFYQTNTEQAYELYKVVREFAQLTGKELVFDLYTGTGTIANFVAHQAKRVIGIEYVPEAIEDAKINAKYNGLENTLFFAGDMKDILNKGFIEKYGRPDVIITDPPRAGMHEDVVNTILFAAPERIVYVSCNPATQARDLNLLDSQYEVVRVQPVDMFPHTQHVENVVLLEKKSK